MRNQPSNLGMSRAKPTGLLTIAGGDFACGVEGDVAEAGIDD